MFDFIYKTIFLLNYKNDNEQYMTQFLYQDMKNFRFASQRLKQDQHVILAFLKKYYTLIDEKINVGFIGMQHLYDPKIKKNSIFNTHSMAWLF
jgi:hypothetical protein